MTTFAERLATLLPEVPAADGKAVASDALALELTPKADHSPRAFLPYGVEALTGKPVGFEDRDYR